MRMRRGGVALAINCCPKGRLLLNYLRRCTCEAAEPDQQIATRRVEYYWKTFHPDSETVAHFLCSMVLLVDLSLRSQRDSLALLLWVLLHLQRFGLRAPGCSTDFLRLAPGLIDVSCPLCSSVVPCVRERLLTTPCSMFSRFPVLSVCDLVCLKQK